MCIVESHGEPRNRHPGEMKCGMKVVIVGHYLPDVSMQGVIHTVKRFHTTYSIHCCAVKQSGENTRKRDETGDYK